MSGEDRDRLIDSRGWVLLAFLFVAAVAGCVLVGG